MKDKLIITLFFGLITCNSVSASNDQVFCSEAKNKLKIQYETYQQRSNSDLFEKTGVQRSTFEAMFGTPDKIVSVLNTYPAESRTPIIQKGLDSASWVGRVDMVSILLKEGAKINYVSKDTGPAILMAIACQRKETFDYLINNGADMYLTTENGGDAMRTAINYDFPYAINVLIGHGYDACQAKAKNGKLSLQQLAEMRGYHKEAESLACMK